MTKKEINAYIGKNVEERRKYDAILTQDNVAEMMGISRAQYANVVNGRGNWDAYKIYVICQILSRTPEEIFPHIVRRELKVKKKKYTKTYTKKVFYLAK